MANMKKGDEADVHVTWEDQVKINLFSKLNAKMYTFEMEKENKEKAKEDLDEIIQEIEFMDEDEPIKYRIGDSFFNFQASEVQALLQQDLDKKITELETIQTGMVTTNSEMDHLKTNLYARFGNAINLERE